MSEPFGWVVVEHGPDHPVVVYRPISDVMAPGSTSVYGYETQELAELQAAELRAAHAELGYDVQVTVCALTPDVTWTSAPDLARLLRVPVGTIHRWANEDDWPRVGRGRRVRYRHDRAVESYERRRAESR